MYRYYLLFSYKNTMVINETFYDENILSKLHLFLLQKLFTVYVAIVNNDPHFHVYDFFFTRMIIL